MSLKVPEALLRGLKEEARRQGVPTSSLVREGAEALLRRKGHRNPPNCLDLVSDLVGSQPGPKDASVNQHYLEEAVVADHVRPRKNSR
jgi:hypothetical protein